MGSAVFLSPRASPERLLLTLPTPKTDPFRKGITLTTAAAGDAACAVTALHHLMSSWPAEPYTPLFSNIPFNTLAADHTDGLANFDRNWVVAKLRDLLQEGVTGHYLGHSFRRGTATWAKQAGIPDSDIQLLGRWKSGAYKQYIEVHPEHIFQVSHRLQTFSPPNASGPPRPTVSPPPDPAGPRGARRPSGRRVGVLGRAGRARESPGWPQGPPTGSAVPAVVAAPPGRHLGRPAAPSRPHSRMK